MKLRDLLKGIEVTGFFADENADIRDISFDSRRTAKGDLFVAIAGFESDGHDFIESAVRSGAVAVICQRAPECDIPYVLVENSRYALAVASKNYFGDPASRMRLAGVTGTNGKTTTTMLIKHIIEECLGAKVGIIGTNQNMIGREVMPAERTTPESYELQKLLRNMADAGCEFVIMEVSSHSLTLDRVAGLRFEVGVFTNLTQDHLDFHATMDKYARAKSVLFSRCEKGAVNLDDDYAQLMISAAQCPIFTYSSASNDANLVAKDIRLSPDEVRFCALTTGNLERVRLGIPGMFSVYNALAAISAGILLGIDSGECADSLKSATGVKGRAETVPTDGDYSIIIDYAHTPDALRNILTSMREAAPGRLVVLFGCGGDRDRLKRPLMGKIAAELSDFAIITSDNPRTEAPSAIIADILEGIEFSKTPYKVIEDRTEAIAYAVENAKPDDVIILAGKGHETYQIVGTEKHHMDEREIVAEILEKRKSGK